MSAATMTHHIMKLGLHLPSDDVLHLNVIIVRDDSYILLFVTTLFPSWLRFFQSS